MRQIAGFHGELAVYSDNGDTVSYRMLLDKADRARRGCHCVDYFGVRPYGSDRILLCRQHRSDVRFAHFSQVF